MAGDFKHPYVAGIICGPKEERRCRALKKRFDAMIQKRRLPLVYLVLKTEPKNIKNISNCMKIMDVVAVNIDPKFTKGKINLILNKKSRFCGYLLKDVVNNSLDLLVLSFEIHPYPPFLKKGVRGDLDVAAATQ